MCCKLFQSQSPRSEFLGMLILHLYVSHNQYLTQIALQSAHIRCQYSSLIVQIVPGVHISSSCLQLMSTQINVTCLLSCTKSIHREPEHFSTPVLLQLGGSDNTPGGNVGQVTKEILREGYLWREHTWSSSHGTSSQVA